ncbi:hypothetical protein EHI8A_067180 [Entamoeba histolytica HM-1:IMSS-B]|uniref:Tumor susceptibility gene 101 protein n=4 Tax=Entamoeba histolytica TaxID=5759 RepID=C4M9Z1_ENTH1|nr:hypothetical protein EHI_131530 [Entamoeba histolytica HM-1:IMSS]EAL43991.2 hypothetical protein EHI_131530 [Entamoeba histolytica HM-1:IMSS]EMH76739.1 hypothetical protein EHI8A_067180 [Entamoeba histolytica HM-1:IMSS-B]ENY62610.1 tumor susceptibility domain containing protein, putative [Entamoeba histolytica HM-1:IMSS-A]GAT98550.1 hypothetical protein CL6EHI_131530 [Entamoeba histolytica]|eukprot:XP_649381.2 hypothetical protein EHI_131530 [Entamoeba histolytica HM-1:IMSS]
MNVPTLEQIFLSIKPMYIYFKRIEIEIQAIQKAFPMSPTVLPHPLNYLQYATLVGTIPIQYLGANYNIPIMIMFPYDYPMKPPFFFTDPSPDMVIVPQHPYAMDDRTIIHPLLQRWNDSSNSLDVLVCLQLDFSNYPPLKKRKENLSEIQSTLKQQIQKLKQGPSDDRTSQWKERNFTNSQPPFPLNSYQCSPFYSQQRPPFYTQYGYNTSPFCQHPIDYHQINNLYQYGYNQFRLLPKPNGIQPHPNSAFHFDYNHQLLPQVDPSLHQTLRSTTSQQEFSQIAQKLKQQQVNKNEPLPDVSTLSLEDIDQLLVEGKISIETYKRMYIDYQRRVHKK